jgi:hypothetical protein
MMKTPLGEEWRQPTFGENLRLEGEGNDESLTPTPAVRLATPRYPRRPAYPLESASETG